MAYGKIKMGKGDGRIKVDPRERGGFNPEPKPVIRPGDKPKPRIKPIGPKPKPRPIVGPGSPGWVTIMPVPNPKSKLGGQENSIPVRNGKKPVGPGNRLMQPPLRTIMPVKPKKKY